VKNSTNELEKTIFSLSKAFDLNFRYSYYLIEENRYIDKAIIKLDQKRSRKRKNK